MRLIPALLILILAAAFAQNPSGGSLTVQVAGRTIGARSKLTFVAGAGIVQTCNDIAGESRLDCSCAYNSAVIPTHDTLYANENCCHSTNGTTSYTCRLRFKALTAYIAGMTFLLDADATCSLS